MQGSKDKRLSAKKIQVFYLFSSCDLEDLLVPRTGRGWILYKLAWTGYVFVLALLHSKVAVLQLGEAQTSEHHSDFSVCPRVMRQGLKEIG